MIRVEFAHVELDRCPSRSSQETVNILVFMSVADQASRACSLYSRTETRALKSPLLGLMLCCHHLEIHNNFKARDQHGYFALGPTNSVAGPTE